MAVSIGTLRMDIIARTEQFEKGLFRTRKELTAARRVFQKNLSAQDKFAQNLNKVDKMLKRGNISLALHRKQVARLTREYRETHTFQGRMFKGMKSGMAQAALAAVSIGTLIRGLRELRTGLTSIDKLDKAAKGMGESVANMQVVAFAASQTAGLAAETANTAMEKMSKRIAEAANNTGEGAAALKLMKVDVQELIKLKPYEQFKFLADAMEEIPHAGTRAALAAKLFDMEARRLHITMKGGSKAIEEWKKQAMDMGILLDQTMVDDAVRANDAIGALSAAWDNFKLTLSASLAPAFEGVAEALMEFTTELAEWRKFVDEWSGPDAAMNTKEWVKSWVVTPLKGHNEMIKKGYEESARHVPLPVSWISNQKKRDEIYDERVKGWQDSTWLQWITGSGQRPKRKFKLLKDDKEAEGKSLLDDESVKSIKSGMTAEQDSLEEYRFLVEKQQRENQARLTTSNTSALDNNTNAILQTHQRDVIHYPKRINMREVQLAP